jgi:signal transduction histidine kinase
MSLKTKILLILIVASIISAVLTGIVLMVLVQLHGQISLEGSEGSILTGLAIAVYLVGGLLILALLDILLNKTVIIPAVERETLENERAMLSEQLHHSQKMEAVGRLAGSIAHDFNNLLTIIDGYTSIIISDPGSKDTPQNAQEVLDAARKASFITRKLLSFSQKEQAEPVNLDLSASLEDTDKMLSRLIGEKIQLITKPVAEPICVKVDPVQLGQVLMNLAVNARDAMPNGGRITITSAVKDIQHGESRKPDTLAEGSYACISVRDTGQGMDEDTLERIFEPFFTTKDADKGTGLGLSIVKDIVKQNKGFIDVQSKLGGGTTFLVYIPVVTEAEEPEAVPAPVEEQPLQDQEPQQEEEPVVPEKAGATILLVEDDPMIRTLVSHTLEDQEYTLILADDGWQAVQMARKHPGNIDILFTDVVMPGLGGAELAVAVRELYPDIKTLFMSGYSRAHVTEEGVPEDAALLEKPFTPDKVVSMVRGLLAE